MKGKNLLDSSCCIARWTRAYTGVAHWLKAVCSIRFTFVNTSSFFPQIPRRLLVRFHSRNSGCERSFPTKSPGKHSGSSSRLYLTPNGLDCLSRIFAVVKLEMSTITGPSSPGSGELKAETRIRPEDSAIERGAPSESLVLATGLV